MISPSTPVFARLRKSHPAMSNQASMPPPTLHVFVDFENVKSIDLRVIGGQAVAFHLFLGAHNKKLDVEVVEKLLAHAPSVQLIRIQTSGKNALDFVLAYHLGQASLADPAGHFHIVSKDTGFDALIGHLRTRNIEAKRHNSFDTLMPDSPTAPPAVKAPTSKAKPEAKAKVKAITPSSLAEKILNYLLKNPNPPKRKKTLISLVRSHLGINADEETAEKIVETLRKKGHLSITEKGAVLYSLQSIFSVDRR